MDFCAGLFILGFVVFIVALLGHLMWLGMAAVGMQLPSDPQHSTTVVAGCLGPGSQDRLHAPVDLPSSGLKQGTQRSLLPHVDCGNKAAWPATAGRHSERQRPSAFASELHVAGLAPGVAREVGAHRRPWPAAQVSSPSCAC